MGKVSKIRWPKGLDTSGWEYMRTHEIEGVGRDYVRIGASDISVITGSNKYKCPARLYHHLTGYHHSFLLTETTLAGHLAEETVMKRWEGYVLGDDYQSLLNVRDGKRVRKVKKADFFLVNSEYPQLFASLDYVFVGKQFSPWTGERYLPLTPNEIKNSREQFYKLWPDGVAQQYKEQVHVQMMMGNTEVTVFHVYLDGSKYIVREIEREKELCQYIDFKSRGFAEIVASGKECVKGMAEAKELGDEKMWEAFKAMYDNVTPEPIGLDDDVDLNKELLDPAIEDLHREATEEEAGWIQSYKVAGDIIKSMQSDQNISKSKLLANIGEYERLTSEFGVFHCRRGREGKRDYVAIK